MTNNAKETNESVHHNGITMIFVVCGYTVGSSFFCARTSDSASFLSANFEDRDSTLVRKGCCGSRRLILTRNVITVSSINIWKLNRSPTLQANRQNSKHLPGGRLFSKAPLSRQVMWLQCESVELNVTHHELLCPYRLMSLLCPLMWIRLCCISLDISKSHIHFPLVVPKYPSSSEAPCNIS
jgi:hypothetical protein